MASKTPPLTRHVASINDLSNSEIETIFKTAQSYLDDLGDPALASPHPSANVVRSFLSQTLKQNTAAFLTF